MILILIIDQDNLDKPITKLFGQEIDALNYTDSFILAVLNEDEEFFQKEEILPQELLSLRGYELLNKFDEIQTTIKIFIRSIKVE